MKRPFFLAMMAIVTSLLSCNKKVPEDSIYYYVRYTGETSTVHIVETTYTVATDTGSDTYKTTGAKSDYSVTIGPVKKGFEASITCGCMETESYYIKSQRVTIEVSRDGEPFAQKATGTSWASYVIDF